MIAQIGPGLLPFRFGDILEVLVELIEAFPFHHYLLVTKLVGACRCGFWTATMWAVLLMAHFFWAMFSVITANPGSIVRCHLPTAPGAEQARNTPRELLTRTAVFHLGDA
jgi:hypothetical protein